MPFTLSISAFLSCVICETTLAVKEYRTTPNRRPSPILPNSSSFAILDASINLSMNVLLSSKFRSHLLRPPQRYHKDPLPSWTITTSMLDTHSMTLGHGKVLHFCISYLSGVRGFQHLPAPIVGVAMLLVRDCTPGLHEYLARQDFVQGVHPVQSERTQSASQLCVLHASDSLLAGHFAPP